MIIDLDMIVGRNGAALPLVILVALAHKPLQSHQGLQTQSRRCRFSAWTIPVPKATVPEPHLTRRYDAFGPSAEFDREQQRQALQAKPLQFLRSAGSLR